jgi:hypothetical protein
LGKAQQVAAVEIALNGIPDCPILKGRRPGKGMMNIESNDPHFQLLLGCTTSGVSGPHGNYGSAHAAPGPVEGAVR